jgi:non-ribosomal peptide synthetase component F
VAGLWTLGFIPYAAVMVPVFGLVPGLGSSAGYAPVALLIALHAAALGRRAPATARGLGIGAGVLVVSLTMRTIDGAVCEAVPLDSEHPLFILYTSGSTGKPKGVMHTTAGYLLNAMLTTKWIFDLKDTDT